MIEMINYSITSRNYHVEEDDDDDGERERK